MKPASSELKWPITAMIISFWYQSSAETGFQTIITLLLNPGLNLFLWTFGLRVQSPRDFTSEKSTSDLLIVQKAKFQRINVGKNDTGYHSSAHSLKNRKTKGRVLAGLSADKSTHLHLWCSSARRTMILLHTLQQSIKAIAIHVPGTDSWTLSIAVMQTIQLGEKMHN